MGKRLVVTTLLALVGMGSSGPLMAQTVEEVLNEHFEAIGGLPKWAALETMKASGTISLGGGVVQGPFEIAQKRPAMSRIDITVQGQNIIQAYDGHTAWQVNGLLGITEPEQADPATAAAIIESADMDGPLIGWREDGHSVELLGIETVDGSEAFKLEVTANGSTSLYYLHAITYLPIRIETYGGTASETTTLSDYRDVGGLMFPFSIALQTQQMVLQFETVEINVAIDESVFSMGGR